MMEVWREGVRILHLDYPFAGLGVGSLRFSAKAMGLDVGVLHPGVQPT